MADQYSGEMLIKLERKVNKIVFRPDVVPNLNISMGLPLVVLAEGLRSIGQKTASAGPSKAAMGDPEESGSV